APPLMKIDLQNTLTSGLLRILSALPYGLVTRIGQGLGSLLYLIPSRRKRILQTNLRLCFPEQTEAQREALASSTFRHVIRSYLERGTQWYGSTQDFAELVELESAIALQDNYEEPTIFLGF